MPLTPPKFWQALGTSYSCAVLGGSARTVEVDDNTVLTREVSAVIEVIDMFVASQSRRHWVMLLMVRAVPVLAIGEAYTAPKITDISMALEGTI